MSSTTVYRNSFHKPHNPTYGPEFFEVGVRPTEYRGYQIYRRLSACWDVVRDGTCITMRAGLGGAKRAIDAIENDSDPLAA